MDKEYNLKKYLSSHTKEENYKLGLKFGEYLRNIHQNKAKNNINSYDLFNTKSNYLFYRHGLSDDIGDNDYILVDFINQNKHLTKNIESKRIIGQVNFENILLDDDNNFLIINKENFLYGDPTFDFTNINKISKISEDFSKACYKSYFLDKKAPIKFFRLLAMYQAYIVLEDIVNKRDGSDRYLTDDEFEYLVKTYDHFNNIIPRRIKESN